MGYRKGSHSIFDFKYHLIWCTKYRYRILTGQLAIRARELIREICRANYVDIVAGSMSPDHVHLLVSVPPSISISKLLSRFVSDALLCKRFSKLPALDGSS